MKNKKIIVVVSIILLILIGTIGFIYIKNEYNKKIDGTSISGYVLGNGIAPDLTPEEIQALLQKKVDASKLAFSVHSEPIFKGKKGTIDTKGRDNVIMALVGDNNEYIDLGAFNKSTDSTKELLVVDKNNGVGTIQLAGVAGKQDITSANGISNDTGVSETFKLVFQIKKKN